MHGIDDRPRRLLQHTGEQRRHIEVLAGTHHSEYFGLQHIDTRVDVAAGNGFFLQAYNINTLCMHNTKRMLPLMLAHRHSSRRAMSTVKIEQLTVSYVGKYIAIGNQK